MSEPVIVFTLSEFLKELEKRDKTKENYPIIWDEYSDQQSMLNLKKTADETYSKNVSEFNQFLIQKRRHLL